MKLGDRVLPTSVLISPDVAEIMLSYQWLHDNRFVWDFHNHVMCIDGQSVPLSSRRPDPLWCVGVCMLRTML